MQYKWRLFFAFMAGSAELCAGNTNTYISRQTDYIMEKTNIYSQAPLPFVGQKRMFASEFRKVLERFGDKTVFVDLFGGSGLLAHITKRERPDATVIYNDHDNYRGRLENIGRTNRLLADLRDMAREHPRHKMITGSLRAAFLERIRQEEQTGAVDYITLSSSLLFSGKYALNLEELGKQSFYNNLRLSDYRCGGYLDGLEVVCCDYKVLADKYGCSPDVVFLVDPPLHGHGHQHIPNGLEAEGLSGCPACPEGTPVCLFHLVQVAHTGFLQLDGGASRKRQSFQGGGPVHVRRTDELRFVLYGYHALQGDARGRLTNITAHTTLNSFPRTIPDPPSGLSAFSVTGFRSRCRRA